MDAQAAAHALCGGAVEQQTDVASAAIRAEGRQQRAAYRRMVHHATGERKLFAKASRAARPGTRARRPLRLTAAMAAATAAAADRLQLRGDGGGDVRRRLRRLCGQLAWPERAHTARRQKQRTHGLCVRQLAR
eukprot:2774797-Pleurochrysis_carterae.AAC.1